jgi:4-hydroxybenzoate polyprenyltransferase
MSQVRNYLSLIKFSHTIFAMPFAMIGFFLGINYLEKQIPKGGWTWWGGITQIPIDKRDLIKTVTTNELLLKLLFVILCMITARSAAMAFNRYLDRNFDSRNPRTAIREIPKGIIAAKSALIFTIVSCLMFILSSFLINSICFYLSPVALFIVLGYSYTKRFTSLCHLILGIGLSLAPIGAFLAVTASFALLPILFSFTVIFWVSGFDIIYALQDEEFDKSQQLHSMPSLLGKSKALRVSELLHFLSFASVIAAGIVGGFGLWYWFGVCIFTAMLIYQHSIVSPTDLSKVNLAFMAANGIASVVFAAFVITDLVVQ